MSSQTAKEISGEPPSTEMAGSSQPGRLWYVTPALVLAVIVLSLWVLYQWVSGYFQQAINALTTVPMAPLSAILFLLVGAALLIEHRQRIRPSLAILTRLIAVFIFLVCLLLLAQFLGVLTADIENFLTPAAVSERGFGIGRLPPWTAGLFALASVSLFVLTLCHKSRRLIPLADILSLGVFVVSLVILMGYWYQAPLFYGGPADPVALTTAVGFLLFSAAQLFNRPENLFYHFTVSSSVTARICRALIPILVIARLAIPYLQDRIEKSFSPALSSTVVVVSTLVVLALIVGVVFVISRRIDRQIAQQESTLRESEKLYRSLFEHMLNGFAYCRVFYERGKPVDFVYLSVNSAFESLTGLRDVVGKKVTEIIPGIRETNPELFEIYGRVALTGQPDKFETYLPALEMWFSVSVYSPVKEHFVAVFDVITARKKAEQALRESEERYRTALDGLMEGYQIIDSDWRYVYLNDVALRHGRRPREELIGRTMMEAYPGIENTEMFSCLKSCLETGISHRLENLFVYPDGSQSWFELSVSPVLEGISILSMDITERKKAEASLAQSAEEWRTTFDSISDWVSIHDSDFRIIKVNAAFADAFRMKAEEIIGKHCYEVIHGTSEPISDCPFEKTIQTKRPAEAESFEPHLGRHIEVATSPIFSDRGEVTGCVHITRDITERKKMEEQLIITDRLASIGQLTSGIAHELNNPLTGVIGFSELLLAKNVPEDVRQELTIINKEARRTADIVKGLLTFARKQRTEKEAVDVNNVIQEVLQLRAYEQRVSNIEVKTRFAADLPEIRGNGAQLQQVFINIIVNAEQAMSAAHHKGVLTIAAERVDEAVRISFSDDGPGIAPENMRRLFTPFFTTKEPGRGTGLGLSICHGIVAEHGGKISVEGEFGKGATFIVELPVSQSP